MSPLAKNTNGAAYLKHFPQEEFDWGSSTNPLEQGAFLVSHGLHFGISSLHAIADSSVV